MQENIEILQKMVIFEGLDEAELSQVAEILEQKSFENEDVIIRKNDRDATMYIVKSGGVNIYFQHGEMQDILLRHLTVGQFFGEMTLFDDVPRSALVMAVGPTETLLIHKNDLFKLFDKNKKMGVKVLKSIAKELCRRLRLTSKDLFASIGISGEALDQEEIDRISNELKHYFRD